MPVIAVTIFVVVIILLLTKQKNVSTPTLPIDNETKKIVYTEVVILDTSTTKNELYSRGREWFAHNSTIRMDDKENGEIVGKRSTQVYRNTLGKDFENGYIYYTISLYLKDGRYKYEITNFDHTGQYINGANIPDYGACEKMINANNKIFNYYLTQMDNHAKNLIVDLKSTMNKKKEF